MNHLQTKLSIKSWAEIDRPREKLRLKGKQSLSDAELIAILLGSGNRTQSAVELAQHILHASDNNLVKISRQSITDLIKFKGIGEAKAVSVIAALELGRRRQAEGPLDRIKIRSSQDAFNIFNPILSDLPYEEFWVVLLNQNNRVLSRHLIGRGGISGTAADIRLIFKTAIEHFATGIIICHNHPSGSVNPSQQDKKLTHQILESGKILTISLLDHIIIGDKGYFSFADSGILK
jgi:DNA repair protein RadC